jgi:RsiW-degrading membrane proteinase PrsW (M82 family)
VVSSSLIRIADHLKQLQEVEHKITDMLFELTSTLRSTVAVFAPLIAGVTLAITVLISTILSSFTWENASETIPDIFGSLSGNPETFALENIRPEYFVLVIGIYLIELVILLTRFTNGINEGDDKATFMYSLGKTMPVSIVVFSLTIIFGQFFFSQIVPLHGL